MISRQSTVKLHLYVTVFIALSASLGLTHTIKAAAKKKAVRNGCPRISTGLPASVRFYPAVPKTVSETAPVVKIRSEGDKSFGADVRAFWSLKSLFLEVNVFDRTAGVIIPGLRMWESDSVQVGIDVAPGRPKQSYTNYYEMGFALLPSGRVARHAWYSGNTPFDWSDVKTTGLRTQKGYRLYIAIPWRCLSVDPAERKVLGINVLVNDGEGEKGRRYVEWTPGIGKSKGPSQFARLILTGLERKAIACLVLPEQQYDKKDRIAARYVQYAFSDMPELDFRLVTFSEDHRRLFDWVSLALPNMVANSTLAISFDLPASRLEQEGKYRLTAELCRAGSKPIVTASASLERLCLETRIQTSLKERKAKLEYLKRILKKHPQLASDSYIKLGIAIAERFIKRVQTGGPTGKQPLEWALLQVNELAPVLAHTEETIRRCLATGGLPVQVPRPTGGPVAVHDGMLYTDTMIGYKSKPVRQPYYFSGYGHYGAVRRDIPRFWDFGVTLIQQDRGPAYAMSPDGKLNNNGRSILKVLDEAAANNVKVDLLLSPHYFPQWIIKEAPDLQPITCPGFIKYNIDHPKARATIKKWLEAIVPLVKDKPALFSLNLSNEPSYSHSGRDPYSRSLWIDYLRKKHGIIKTINELYGTNHKNLESVPVPPIGMPKTLGAHRAYYDWIRFNQEHFADWHRWMNGIVKKHAPNVPTSCKIMPDFGRIRLLKGGGIDPELICQITDWAGNDCWARYPSGSYVYDWQLQEIWYDLLHSFRNQPVFNSENHFIADRTPAISVPPAHTRAVLWQGALHHQVATTCWVWEEPAWGTDRCKDLRGNIFLRPSNIYAAGRAMLDMNRFANEIATINRAKPRIALLYSVPSMFWDRHYEQSLRAFYTALTFMGQPITFVSERQLRRGKFAKVDWIITPQAGHVFDSTINALKKYVQSGGKIISVGTHSLMWDEYHRKRSLPAELAPTRQFNNLHQDTKAAFGTLRAKLVADGLKVTDLRMAGSGSLVWGVEYRVVPYKEGLLVPMISFLSRPQLVRLGLTGQATDLLTGEQVDMSKISLEPMEPKLIRVWSTQIVSP